jgi:hypothetical protein
MWLVKHTESSGARPLQNRCGLPHPNTQLSQSLRSLCDHVYSPLQFLLQVGDVHLVRDAIRVADALHKPCFTISRKRFKPVRTR